MVDTVLSWRRSLQCGGWAWREPWWGDSAHHCRLGFASRFRKDPGQRSLLLRNEWGAGRQSCRILQSTLWERRGHGRVPKFFHGGEILCNTRRMVNCKIYLISGTCIGRKPASIWILREKALHYPQGPVIKKNYIVCPIWPPMNFELLQKSPTLLPPAAMLDLISAKEQPHLNRQLRGKLFKFNFVCQHSFFFSCFALC